jgi:hypothetical protein
MKNSNEPSGIEPANFRFVAQRLNNCATAVPQDYHSTVLLLHLITLNDTRIHTHTHTLTPYDSPGRRICRQQRSLHIQHTTITRVRYVCPGEIRTLNPSKQAAADPRLRRLSNPKAKFLVKPVFSLRQIYIRGAALHKTLF